MALVNKNVYISVCMSPDLEQILGRADNKKIYVLAILLMACNGLQNKIFRTVKYTSHKAIRDTISALRWSPIQLLT